MPALIPTIGAANANSYCTLQEAETYFDQRRNTSAWDEADYDDRIRALIEATRWLEDEAWREDRVSSTQALAWPRVNVPKKDAIGNYGFGSSYQYREVYQPTEIPEPVKRAQMELALAMLDGRFDDGESEQVQSWSDDKTSVTYRFTKPAGGLPVTVVRLLNGLVHRNRIQRA